MKHFRYDGDGKVDSVLTFVELRQLFTEFNIRESQLEFSEFDPPLGYKGSLYPVSNGILQAAGLNEDLLTGQRDHHRRAGTTCWMPSRSSIPGSR